MKDSKIYRKLEEFSNHDSEVRRLLIIGDIEFQNDWMVI